ncbi:MAG: hypothetical protein H8D84_00505 [Proteobacteria bacterium]|jgi:hypothetical protein|nr:hypothetical protein [Pseudomonadota bacterium]
MANTTSGTVTFDKTFSVDEIIAEAYERIGSQVTSGYQLKSARRSLNVLFQEWGNRGLHYWEVAETNIDVIEGQAEYTFYRASGDGTSSVTTAPASVYGVADILEATLRSDRTATGQSDSSLTKIARSAYSALSSKLSKGTPSQYFVQRFVDKTTLTVYPTSDSTNASKDIHIYYVKRLQDADATYTDATNIPYRFVPCMVSGLAFYLAQKFNPQLVQQMKLLYEDELARALAEDGSSASTYITPKNYYPNI